MTRLRSQKVRTIPAAIKSGISDAVRWHTKAGGVVVRVDSVVHEVCKGIEAHDDGDEFEGVPDVVEADRIVVGVLVLYAEEAWGAEVAFWGVRGGRAIEVEKGQREASGGEVAAAELEGLGVVLLCGIWGDPDAVAAEGRLEALDADDGKEEPEEGDEEGDVEEEGRGELEAAEDAGVAAGDDEEAQDAEAGEHAEDMEGVAVVEGDRDPEGEHGDQVEPVERVAQECGACGGGWTGET
ncbi:hypothetical protein NEOLI_005238 [Neolecta irregularis DAH-3]|uniref:Uncharacterized protein n=1 Tax=Neolecta irregularis (strain DAH-3) TaxID=1198029 RepID=A0A1U7LN23_NEOID|nr:hypothetical protein NEOLI_005238 [Neolecta irregularis DAH-3]|eukprot:OLL24055.1 hypothetical protein NEOLI_005238 [Neolecta irregularis DAH-3]